MDKFYFSLDGTEIPASTEKPVKSEEKVFDCRLRDAAAIPSTIKELEAWPTTTDKSGITGRFNTWIYQHII